jgi:hypothetical protein
MLRSIGLTLASLVCVVPLFAQKVNVDYDKSQNFSTLHTYKWRKSPMFEQHPELEQKYYVGIQMVMDLVNQQLMAKGFQPADGATPDFFVTFVIGTENRTESTTISSGYGYTPWYTLGPVWQPMWDETMTSQYVAGSLILDMVGGQNHQLLWRAYCFADIREPNKRYNVVKKTINKALKDFPPKAS